jgi:hypothetical protein
VKQERVQTEKMEREVRVSTPAFWALNGLRHWSRQTSPYRPILRISKQVRE